MNNVDYSKLRSISSLRTERRRISRELDGLGDKLRDDYRGITRMFSLSFVMGQLTGKANQIYNLVQWSMSGYHFILSMIDKYKASRQADREKEQ